MHTCRYTSWITTLTITCTLFSDNVIIFHHNNYADTNEVPAAGYLSVLQLVSIITPVAVVLLLVTVVSVSALICCIRRDKKEKGNLKKVFINRA